MRKTLDAVEFSDAGIADSLATAAFCTGQHGPARKLHQVFSRAFRDFVAKVAAHKDPAHMRNLASGITAAIEFENVELADSWREYGLEFLKSLAILVGGVA